MKTVKKSISFLLVLTLVFSLFCTGSNVFTASATEVTSGIISDYDEAVRFLTNEFNKRTDKIVIKYRTADYNETIYSEMFHDTFKHTGNPMEGDYIRWNYKSMTYGISVSFNATSKLYTYTLTFEPKYRTTAEQENELAARIDEIFAELDLNNKDDFGKIKAVYDYIKANIVYDHSGEQGTDLRYTAYAALINGTSVCQGYSLLLYRMLLKAGVDVRMIGGIGNGGAHSWDIVKLGNYYYNIDGTWDAELGSYDYFLKSKNDFYDHQRDDEYATTAFEKEYPMAAKSHSVNGHIYNSKVTPPTCEEDGCTDYCCKECEYTYSSDFKEATGHSASDWIIDVNATCTATGAKHKECTVCEKTIETEEIPVINHNYVTYVTSPTCTSAGYTTYKCSNCGNMYKSDETALLNHNYVATGTVEATCSKGGYTIYTCSNCSATYNDNYTQTLEHTQSDWITDAQATCSKSGAKHTECTVCHTVMQTAEIPQTEHIFVPTTVAATCTGDGYTVNICSVCRHATAKTDIVPATGHTYTESVVLPTCTAKGYTLHTCSVCSDSYKDNTVNATGHTDADNNGYCDSCNKGLTASTCSCRCHSGGFIWKLLRFFYKLFRANQYCACGAAHY